MDILELKKNPVRFTNRHPWEKARVQVIFDLLKKDEKFQHLLDIGSGDGYILSKLYGSDIAFNYTAIDTAYTEKIIRQIALNDYNNIHFYNYLPLSINPGPDVILALDVIEHCENDAELLQYISSIASKHNFKLIITVPAFQTLFSAHDKMLQHYRRYSKKQLIHLCEVNGLKVEQAGYFFLSLLFIRWIQVFCGKIGIFKPHKTIDNWNGSKLTSKLIYLFLWCDYRISRLFLSAGFTIPGLSAYCVCHPLR